MLTKNKNKLSASSLYKSDVDLNNVFIEKIVKRNNNQNYQQERGQTQSQRQEKRDNSLNNNLKHQNFIFNPINQLKKDNAFFHFKYQNNSNKIDSITIKEKIKNKERLLNKYIGITINLCKILIFREK